MRRLLAIPLAAAALAVTAGAASAAAPTSFPVHDSGSFLVTGHPVTSGERLVIRGRPVQLGSVTKAGPAYVAHVLGVLPKSWADRTLAAVPEG